MLADPDKKIALDAANLILKLAGQQFNANTKMTLTTPSNPCVKVFVGIDVDKV